MDITRFERECLPVKPGQTYDDYVALLKSAVDRMLNDSSDTLSRASFSQVYRQLEISWIEVKEQSRHRRWDWVMFFSYKYVCLLLDYVRKHRDYRKSITGQQQRDMQQQGQEAMNNVETGNDGYLQLLFASRQKKAQMDAEAQAKDAEIVQTARRGFKMPATPDMSRVSSAVHVLLSVDNVPKLLPLCRGEVSNVTAQVVKELGVLSPTPYPLPAVYTRLSASEHCVQAYLQLLLQACDAKVRGLFDYQAASCVICPKCGKSQDSPCPASGLDLPIPVPPSPLPVAYSLEDCLAGFSDEVNTAGTVQQPGGYAHAWRCPECLAFTQTPRRRRAVVHVNNSSAMPPAALCIKLQRFPAAGHKVATEVSFPQHLDVAPYSSFAEGTETSLDYELKAVVNHHGASLEQSHFSTVTHSGGSTWLWYDDPKVTPVEAPSRSPDVYMLVYRLKGRGKYVPRPVTEKPRGHVDPALPVPTPAPTPAAPGVPLPLPANPYAPMPPSALYPPPAEMPATLLPAGAVPGAPSAPIGAYPAAAVPQQPAVPAAPAAQGLPAAPSPPAGLYPEVAGAGIPHNPYTTTPAPAPAPGAGYPPPPPAMPVGAAQQPGGVVAPSAPLPGQLGASVPPPFSAPPAPATPGVAVPAQQGQQAFAKGDAVWYTGSGGEQEEARVVAVDLTSVPPSYTVRIERLQRERSTEAARLAPYVPPDVQSLSAPVQALLRDTAGYTAQIESKEAEAGMASLGSRYGALKWQLQRAVCSVPQQAELQRQMGIALDSAQEDVAKVVSYTESPVYSLKMRSRNL